MKARSYLSLTFDMNIITTNYWSCVLDSFADAINVHPGELIEEVGHDGDHTGFHTQELVDALCSRSYSTTEIIRYPKAINPNTGEDRFIFPGSHGDIRFANHMRGNVGVLIGFKDNHKPHAVSWKLDTLRNPTIGSIEQKFEWRKNASENCLEQLSNRSSFIPTKFLRISRIV